LPLLNGDRAREWVVDAFESARAKLKIDVWAYVIMPEHVHVLLYPRGDEYAMRRILVALKRPVSVAAREHLDQSGNQKWLNRLRVKQPSGERFRFWQPGGGYDRNVVCESSARAMIDYIHANPVRRGLVKSPTDWEWSSARFWAGMPGQKLHMDDPAF
jgi:putative transposase